MPLLTLDALVTPATYDDVVSLELTIAADLGMPTTAWEPIDPLRTILTTNAQIVADYTTTINQIAQGGYASYAAVIPGSDSNVDSQGYETTWMDLVSTQVYNVQRIEAGQASTTVNLVNSTSSTFGSPYGPGTLHLQSPLGAQPTFSNVETVNVSAAATGGAASITYSGSGFNTVTGLSGASSLVAGVGTIVISGAAHPQNNGTFVVLTVPSSSSVTVSAPNGATDGNNGSIGWVLSTPTTVEIVADAAFPGPTGNVPSGTTLTLVTSLIGVMVAPLTAAVVATAQETNAALLTRCQNKLGSLSPNGPSQAYQYVVQSLPVVNSTLPDGTVWTVPTALYPYGVITAITRASTVLNTGAGIVNVYTANSAGAPPGCVQLPITGVTNASPPVVTTSSAHGLAAGNFVVVRGVQGATGVNNSITGQVAWSVQIVSSTQVSLYELDGITAAPAPGAYASGGTVDGGDLGMADAAIQAQVVPDGTTAIVQGAGTVSINIGTNASPVGVYIRSNGTLTVAQAITNIENEVAAYLATIPIGGIAAEASNVVPYSEILVTIANANTGTVSVAPLTVNGGTSDVTLSLSQVPVIGTWHITVNFV